MFCRSFTPSRSLLDHDLFIVECSLNRVLIKNVDISSVGYSPGHWPLICGTFRQHPEWLSRWHRCRLQVESLFWSTTTGIENQCLSFLRVESEKTKFLVLRRLCQLPVTNPVTDHSPLAYLPIQSWRVERGLGVRLRWVHDGDYNELKDFVRRRGMSLHMYI